ncbi:MAG: ABC transporter ATP-binding protein [Caldisericaceae bacterium]|nr:ABC transporter ATP-binding protein [Caldisericaceae bacterium]
MILEVRDIAFSYGKIPILSHINLEVEKGKVISVLGVNGAGKSTLLKCINGILKVQSGKILINGKEISKMSRTEIAREISYVPQRSEAPFITVFDAVLLGRKPYIKWDATKKDIEITRNVLKMLDIEKLSLRYVTELSGGEFQKVVIARALVQQPKLMLLDEPTNSLDIKNQFEVMDIIKRISRVHNIASVVVMHDINLALRFSDGFVLMKEGKIFASGGIEVITSENVESVYGIPVTVEKINGHILVEPIYQTSLEKAFLSMHYG